MKKPFKEEDKVFHAAPTSNGIGQLSFALYNDNRYQVVNSGGIGATYYEGMYTLTGDTIVLKGLDKGSPFSSNRLLIHRYSTSIPDTARFEQGQMLHGESASGEVYPLDEKNQFKNDFYFYIVLDSLKH